MKRVRKALSRLSVRVKNAKAKAKEVLKQHVPSREELGRINEVLKRQEERIRRLLARVRGKKPVAVKKAGKKKKK